MVPRTEAELQFEIVAAIWTRVRRTTLPIYYPGTTRPVVDHAAKRTLAIIGRAQFGLAQDRIDAIRRRVNIAHLRHQTPLPNDPLHSFQLTHPPSTR